MNRPMPPWPLAVPSVPASLFLVCTAVGFVVVVGLGLLTLIPLLLLVGGFLLWLVFSLLVGWAAIEGLAACERWMERNPRFHR